jgi:hypothetical protein
MLFFDAFRFNGLILPEPDRFQVESKESDDTLLCCMESDKLAKPTSMPMEAGGTLDSNDTGAT